MTESIRPGLREELITAEVQRIIDAAKLAQLEAAVDELANSEAADRLARFVAELTRRAVEAFPEDERATSGVDLIRRLLIELGRLREGSVGDDELPLEPGSVLRGLLRILPGGEVEAVERPLTPLVDTTVFTNARGEPRVLHELRTEFASAEAVDVVVAFIRVSGIAPLLSAIRRHCEAGGRVRVLTTTFTGTTDGRALEELERAGAEVRVSYDTSGSRLHAKAWIFHRGGGYSTAYVGSSNLTHSAQITGLEWNVRLAGARNPDALAKISAVFESYWFGGDFVRFDAEEFAERTDRPEPGLLQALPLLDIEPRPFQARLLELLQVSREDGHHRNLLVAATGTGKTVMAALDFARLRSVLPRSRLLFVAHREEILRQSLATFRVALRDTSFGELWVGGARPRKFEHVFASIQTLSAVDPETIKASHFDVVVIDEFHHAAAPTYARLLNRLEPRELLGLTATPERSDGLDVLSHFGNRIAAELRIWDAIDEQYLVPFVYYGIHDGNDLTGVRWRRGRGYDVGELTSVLTADHLQARRIVDQIRQHASDPEAVRALGFCVSVAHADFMAQQFCELGVNARAVSAATPGDERRQALLDLQQGRLQAIFSVDLFNEGVDLPDVNTLLLLRPTESGTLFLQQLGRGLRKAPGKSSCLVLDFVGLHRREFRYDGKLRSLFGGTRRELVDHVSRGFPFLPAGCHMELDAVSQEVVLGSIRNSLPSTWRERCEELRAMGDVSLAEFLQGAGLELEDVYSGNRSWSELRRAVGLPTEPSGDSEDRHLRAIGRMLHVDDRERLSGYQRLVSLDRRPEPVALTAREQGLLRMMAASLTPLSSSRSMTDALDMLWSNRQVRAELAELADLLRERVAHEHQPLDCFPDVPLQVHARYTRIEILAAFSTSMGARPQDWREGVRYEPSQNLDILAFTLDKTSGGFSPTTRYRDYAVSRDLIHWESQSGTTIASPTGQRYITQGQHGGSVIMFARLRADDRSFWCLGPADYIGHEGERPIAITWRLRSPLPGDLYGEFAAAVA